MLKRPQLFYGTLVTLLALTLGPTWAEESSPPASSAPPPAEANPSATSNGALTHFAEFLSEHANIEARLCENPSLISNEAFQKNHPQLTEFLAQHPALQADLAGQPRWFIHRELVRKSANPISADQIAEFDRFLDQHPDVEKQLAQHPQQLRHSDFLKNHAELREYIKQHPALDRLPRSRPNNPVKPVEQQKPRVRVKP